MNQNHTPGFRLSCICISILMQGITKAKINYRAKEINQLFSAVPLRALYSDSSSSVLSILFSQTLATFLSVQETSKPSQFGVTGFTSINQHLTRSVALLLSAYKPDSITGLTPSSTLTCKRKKNIWFLQSPTCRGEAQRAHPDLGSEVSRTHVTCADTSSVSQLWQKQTYF